MAEIWLDCGHPAIVTHERGERLITCAAPTCDGSNTVRAYPRVQVVYEVLRAPLQLEDTAAAAE